LKSLNFLVRAFLFLLSILVAYFFRASSISRHYTQSILFICRYGMLMDIGKRTVINNRCVLYKQTRSTKWYCRIKLETGEWYRAATGTDDLEEATEKALKIYYESQVKLKNNLPQTTRSFASVAKSVIASLEELRDTTSWKQTYKDYIRVINKYQIPYFGRTRLDNIRKAYEGYIAYVSKELGRTPAASTISTHHSALKLILDKSVEHGWLVNSALPILRNDGKESSRRATFELAEYRTLIRKLRHWIKKPTHRQKDAEIKELLYDYVLILAYSGIRHGREAMDIKWRNVSFANSVSDKELVVLDVLKKKGRKGTHKWRKVVVRHNRFSDARKVLTRLKDRVPELRGMTLEAIIKAKLDIPLFCLSDKSQPKRMDGTFKKFLLDSKLGVGSEDKMRSLYSLRHFYATQQLTKANPISVMLLSKQMGTSVKMIEQYYGHLDTVKAGDELSGWTEF